jgi:hypothetical protein
MDYADSSGNKDEATAEADQSLLDGEDITMDAHSFTDRHTLSSPEVQQSVLSLLPKLLLCQYLSPSVPRM